jgi:hypothetical protein
MGAEVISPMCGFAAIAVLPDGSGGFTPCPELLTESEAVRFLRLDTMDIKNPTNTLRYYREKKKLKGTHIGKRVFYSRKALDQFLEKMTND